MFKRDNSITSGKGEWNENEHPRDMEGKFTSGGGGSTPFESPMKKPKNLYDKNKYIMLSKKEYAELCSAIRTKHTDKIPKLGYMLYKDDFYMYTYNKRTEQIFCTEKVSIIGNEERINEIIRSAYEFNKKRK